VKSRLLNTFAVTALVILSFLVLKALVWHYWLILAIWLVTPVLMLWLRDIKSISDELKGVLKNSLIAISITFSLFTNPTLDLVKENFAKQYIEGYRIVISHDCEPAENFQGGSDGEPPETCPVEDLSRVNGLWRVFLYLESLFQVILLFLIPSATLIFKDKKYPKQG